MNMEDTARTPENLNESDKKGDAKPPKKAGQFAKPMSFHLTAEDMQPATEE